MVDKDPAAWELATWLLAIGMSSAGGLVNWYARVRQGHSRAFNVIELIGEVFTSAFVGVGVFMGAQALEQPTGICAALAGIGGHMATRVLFAAEKWIELRIKNYTKKSD